ncbi:unnamed protein product [Ranitomeya imitator]|uniref:Uncharacterized protein n=1 Tax=Ranitomeya imitator TaxID=111125 RepID=A0ABN9MFE1_9NEOB|nr:unnamed protein product [Ranitomeya imitator]
MQIPTFAHQLQDIGERGTSRARLISDVFVVPRVGRRRRIGPPPPWPLSPAATLCVAPGAVGHEAGEPWRPPEASHLALSVQGGFFPDTLRIGRLAPYSVHDLPSGTALAVQAPFFLRKVMPGDARLLARTTTGISPSFGRSSCCAASFPASLPRLIKSLSFVHTARRYYRLDGLVRSLDRPRRGRPRPMVESREDDRT